MALNTDKATKSVVKDIKVLFGVPKQNFMLEPLVNANNEQLEKMGFYTFKDEQGNKIEPKYLRPKLDSNKVEMGHNQLQLEFYFKLVDAAAEGFPTMGKEYFRMSFYIQDIEQPITDKNKFCYVNEIGETAWAVDMESVALNSFCTNPNMIRVVKRNEKDFLSSIHQIAGLRNGILIDDIDTLLTGDVSEIVDLVNDINAQEGYKGFKALLTVKTTTNGKFYQNVFTRAFDSGTVGASISTKAANIQREIKKMNEDQGGQYALKDYYGNKAVVGLVEFNEDMVQVDAPAAYVPGTTQDNDDMPF